jgi:hypothetical protein
MTRIDDILSLSSTRKEGPVSPELQQVVAAINEQGFKITTSSHGALCVVDYDGRVVGAFTPAADWRNVLAVMQGHGLIWHPIMGALLPAGGSA